MIFKLILLLSLAIFIKYIFINKNIDIQFENFKIEKRNSNICMKPFRPTCNRDKIFSRLRLIEDKLDEIEYDIYKSNKKQQKFDQYMLDEKKRKKRRDKDVKAAREKAIKRINNLIGEKRNNIINDVNKEREEDVRIQQEYAKQQKIYNKRNEKDALNDFKSSLNKKKDLNNYKSSLDRKNSKSKIQLSGNNEETEIMQDMINESSQNIDSDEEKEYQDAVKEIDMPPGFVF